MWPRSTSAAGTPRPMIRVPLLGMELLWQSRITLEARADGPVAIEPLG